MTNPLDDLLTNPTLPTRKTHSSGRRELRQQLLEKGITMHHRAATNDEALQTVQRGQAASVTLPIRRAVPKLTKAEKKAAKRARQRARRKNA